MQIWLELFTSGSRGREPGDDLLRRVLADGHWPLPGEPSEALGRGGSAGFAAFVDGRLVGGLGARRFPEAAARILARANRAVADRFDVFGFEGLSYGDPIDWHRDPLHGQRAPLVHWSRVPYLDVGRVGDHKVIWELNRHQHLVTLGQAYGLTGDEQYASTIVRHMTEWMNANPPNLGINWSSSLELAFRAISWAWALQLVRSSRALSPAFIGRALKFLYFHARHVSAHLSTYFSPNTHLTGEALGLFYVGTYFPHFRDAERWRETGWSILDAEVQRQVRPDGIYFEQTTWYHRYTADFYLHALQIRRQAGQPVRDGLRRHVEKLVDALAQFTGPDGRTPLIGDDDGGQLLSLRIAAPDDFRATLAHAAVVLGRGEYASLAGDGASCLPWLVGAAGLTAFDAMDARPPRDTARLFPDGGYFVARDRWTSDANFVVVDCGPHGAHSCGHAHADALSVELTLAGVPILVDAGTGSYAQPERDQFRGTPAHNTITIDGLSSSQPDRPFRWKTAANCKIIHATADERLAFFEGEHDGFMRLADPARHRRTVFALFGEMVVMLDSIDARGSHEIAGRLHFSPALTVTEHSDHAGLLVALQSAPARPLADVFVLGDDVVLGVERGRVAPAYATSVEAPVGTFSSRGTGSRLVWTLLVARQLAADRPSVSRASSSSANSLTIITGDREDVCVAGKDGLSFGDLATDAEWLWVRRAGASARPDEFALVNASRLTIAGTPVVSLSGRRKRIRGRPVEGGWELHVSPA